MITTLCITPAKAHVLPKSGQLRFRRMAHVAIHVTPEKLRHLPDY
jgi:hypothetical protein